MTTQLSQSSSKANLFCQEKLELLVELSPTISLFTLKRNLLNKLNVLERQCQQLNPKLQLYPRVLAQLWPKLTIKSILTNSVSTKTTKILRHKQDNSLILRLATKPPLRLVSLDPQVLMSITLPMITDSQDKGPQSSTIQKSDTFPHTLTTLKWNSANKLFVRKTIQSLDY